MKLKTLSKYDIAPTIKDSLRSYATYLLKGRHADTKFPISLMVGKTGHAIFLAYYAQFLEDEHLLDASTNILVDLFDDLEITDSDSTGFGLGIAGLTWTLNLFLREGFMETDNDTLEALQSFDGFYTNWMLTELNKGVHDYMHGALGYAMNLIERSTYEPALRKELEKVLDIMDQQAIRNSGIYWKDPAIEDKVSVNFGLSHGLPSMLVLFGKLYERNIAPQKSLELAEGIIQFLQEHYDPSNQFGFPSTMEFGDPRKGSRLAWCYGDLGVSFGIGLAGQMFDRPKWIEWGREIATHTLTIRLPEETLIVDGGLCHGYAGVAHVYKRLFDFYGEESFHQASTFWMQELLQFIEAQGGLLNFQELRGEAGWFRCDGLLGGATGAALAMLSYINPKPPKWDGCLLLN